MIFPYFGSSPSRGRVPARATARAKGGAPARGALALLLVLIAPITLGAQAALDQALGKNGFTRLSDKSMPVFSAKGLEGEDLDNSFFEERPVLMLVSSGAPPAELKALPEFPLSIGMLVITTDTVADAAKSWEGHPEWIAVCPGALRILRAMGGPVPPTWIVALPGGRLYASRGGSLAGAALGQVVTALAQAAPGVTAPAAAAPQTTPPPTTPVTVPLRPPATAQAPAEPPATTPVTVPLRPPATPPAPSAAATTTAAATPPAAFLSQLEGEVLAELNLARTDPAAYVAKLKVYRVQIIGTRWERPGRTTVMLEEGRAAVDEAIAVLSKQAPLPPFSASAGLSLAARDLAADQGRSGATGHTGADGSDPGARVARYGTWQRTMGENIAYGGEAAEEFVMQLIVDDGVPSRGHRTNIYNADFLVIGIATGRHPGFRTVCVMDFAGGYIEKQR